MAVFEEYTRTDERGRTLVRIRRCVSLGRERARGRQRKDPNLRSTRKCGEVEVLDEVLERLTA